MQNLVSFADHSDRSSCCFDSTEPIDGLADIKYDPLTLSAPISDFVPSFKDNTNNDRLHVCIAAVADVLTDVVNDDWVFGIHTTGLGEASMRMWGLLPSECVQHLYGR